MKVFCKGVFVGVVTASVCILLILFNQSSPPEVEEIERIESPGGEWTAKVDMVVYGDHWFVNDARNEVKISRSDGTEREVLVYSEAASAASYLAVKWCGGNSILIMNSSKFLRDAFRYAHSSVRINYGSDCEL